MRYILAGLTAGVVVGAVAGLMGATRVASLLPPRTPIYAENIHAQFMPNGNWRVSEDIVIEERCDYVVLERRFKDEVLDQWVFLDPVSSFPPNIDGGISRAHLGVGRAQGWAEYDPRVGGVHRGAYNVTINVTRCESGYEDIYPLIVAVEYDFTAPTRPTPPHRKP